MIACACCGILEIGVIAFIVSAVSAIITRIVNFIRRRRHNQEIAEQLMNYAQQSNEELAS